MVETGVVRPLHMGSIPFLEEFCRHAEDDVMARTTGPRHEEGVTTARLPRISCEPPFT